MVTYKIEFLNKNPGKVTHDVGNRSFEVFVESDGKFELPRC